MSTRTSVSSTREPVEVESTRAAGASTGSVRSHRAGYHRTPYGDNLNYDPQNLVQQIMSSQGYPDNADGQKQLQIDLLNVLKTIDQRQYDRYLTEDDRKYNSIQSQMSRLMSLGMSRDQALAMLSNSPTTIQNTAAPFGTDASIFPSATDLNRQNAAASEMGMVTSGIQTALSLITTMMGLPSVLSGNQIAQNAAYISGQQADAYKALGVVGSLAGNAIKAGSLVTDNLKDRDSFVSGMDSLYAADPQYQGAMGALYSNPFGMQVLDDYVNQNFNTKKVRPTSDMVEAATKATLTNYLSSKIQYDELCASLDLTRAQIDSVVANTETTNVLRDQTLSNLVGQGNLIDAQVEQSKAQSGLLSAQTELSRSQTTAQQQANYIQSYTVKAYELSGSDYTAALTTELALKLNALNAANTEDSRNAVFESIVSNNKLSRCMSAINLLNAESAQEFLKGNESLQSVVGLIQTTDFDKYMNMYLTSKGIDLRATEIISDELRTYPISTPHSFKLTKDLNENLRMISGSLGNNPFGIFDPLMK